MKGDVKAMKRYVYEEYSTVTVCKVYDYDMDTAREMKADGWTLTGTYYGFLTFRKDK